MGRPEIHEAGSGRTSSRKSSRKPHLVDVEVLGSFPDRPHWNRDQRYTLACLLFSFLFLSEKLDGMARIFVTGCSLRNDGIDQHRSEGWTVFCLHRVCRVTAPKY